MMTTGGASMTDAQAILDASHPADPVHNNTESLAAEDDRDITQMSSTVEMSHIPSSVEATEGTRALPTITTESDAQIPNVHNTSPAPSSAQRTDTHVPLKLATPAQPHKPELILKRLMPLHTSHIHNKQNRVASIDFVLLACCALLCAGVFVQ
jgi:hypothetical protein